MCGFAALIGEFKPPEASQRIKQMCDSMKHRGPDDEGMFASDKVYFGFRRLSIIDLTESGHQPMATPDGKAIIVFNGEIYNYIELREELEALGYRFHSQTDTEVLLYAYLHWGADCLKKLNGMWAFLIYDTERNLVFGARDRFGKKPLYRYFQNGHFVFASEIKGILASGYYKGGVNWKVAANYLVKGHLDVSPSSFLAGIEQVPAGYAFTLGLDGTFRQWRYWQVGDTQVDYSDPIASFRELFRDSVRLRLRSDVPVGICLSGGLDSTSIACTAKGLNNGDSSKRSDLLHAFSYFDPNFDETTYIEDTIRETGATLNPFSTSADYLWSELEKMLYFQDEPIHSMAAVVGFEIFGSAAQKGIKVVLSGQGADELFAGYTPYFLNYHYSLMRSGKFIRSWKESQAYSRDRDIDPRRFYLEALRLLLHTPMEKLGVLSNIVLRKRLSSIRKDPWFRTDLTSHLGREDLMYGDFDLSSALHRSITSFPLPLYLRIEDRNSMAHSVEARLPFMDYRIGSLAFQLSDEMKIRGTWSKYILREVMKGQIPESIRTRKDKMGYPTSQLHWFRGPLSQAVREVLSSPSIRERGIYHIDSILSDFEGHVRGDLDATQRLFRVVCFELWCRLFAKYI